MTYETATYLTTYFPRLMTGAEYEAKQHAFGRSKLEHSSEEFKLVQEKKFKEWSWLSSNKEVIALLDEGYEQFILNTATRISRDSPEEFCLNICPKCKKLARTPYARQCRHCRHAWHDIVVGTFKFEHGFRVTRRGYFIAGEVTAGEVSIGDHLDLSRFQLNLFPKITGVEHANLGSDDPRIGIPALGFSLTKEEEYLVKTFLRKTAIDLHIINTQ